MGELGYTSKQIVRMRNYENERNRKLDGLT